MKRLLSLITVLACFYVNVFSQATSLTVDCQNPGWLSSKIDYEDQLTLESLTVTGYINDADFKFLGGLFPKSLLFLDLTDAVYSESDILPENVFGLKDYNKRLKKIALPKKMKGGKKCLDGGVTADTMIVGSEYYHKISVEDLSTKNIQPRTNYLILREGVDSIADGAFSANSNVDRPWLVGVEFPNSLVYIGKNAFLNRKCLETMKLPDSIKEIRENAFSGTLINPDTLVLPKSLEYYCLKAFNYQKNHNSNKTKVFYFSENIKVINIKYSSSYNNMTSQWTNSDAITSNYPAEIHLKSAQPPKIEYYSYDNQLSGATIYVPKGTSELYKNTDGYKKATIIEEILVEDVIIDKHKKLYVGDKEQISVSVIPSDALNQNISWLNSNPEIASVTDSGLVTALEPGETTITVKTEDGDFQDQCVVYVYDHTTGINMQTSLTMRIGDKYTINATTLPLGTSDGLIFFKSDDNEIATIDETGLVKAKGKGTCIITATSVDGSHVAKCEVKVLQPVKELSLDNHYLQLNTGTSLKLTPSISPSDADNKTILWSSADASIATVDETGNVTACKAGETWIKAVSADNPEACDSCKVAVLQPVTGISLDKTDYTMKEIGESLQLEATVLPEDANNKNVVWKSSDEKVCFVSNGKVVAVGYGTCVIIATTEEGGFMATCKVTVQEPIVITVTAVSMEKHELTLNVGAAEKVNVVVSPANAENKTLAWMSTDETVVTVDSEGNVTALQTGETWIKAISEGNAEVSDSCLVSVRQPATGIMLSSEECTLSGIGSTAQLTVLFQPENASNQNVTWKSLNEKICTVTDGTVTAVGKGTSVVIATSEDGGFMAYCTITVEEAAAIPGDVNQDGKVDISDIVAIINTIAGDTTYRNTANVNNDSNIDISDIVAVINIIAGQ